MILIENLNGTMHGILKKTVWAINNITTGSVAVSNLAACVNSHCAVSNNTATIWHNIIISVAT